MSIVKMIINYTLLPFLDVNLHTRIPYPSNTRTTK